jgi:hypothetical protein
MEDNVQIIFDEIKEKITSLSDEEKVFFIEKIREQISEPFIMFPSDYSHLTMELTEEQIKENNARNKFNFIVDTAKMNLVGSACSEQPNMSLVINAINIAELLFEKTKDLEKKYL